MDQLPGFLGQEAVHLLVGASIGTILFFLTRKFWVFAGAIIFSLSIDIDHLFDYIRIFNLQINFPAIITGEYAKISGLLFLPLHSWELNIILLILGLMLFTKKTRKKKKNWLGLILIVIALAFSGHLMVDILMNNISWQAYFISIRTLHSFVNPTLWQP